jgi:hypothetical protein
MTARQLPISEIAENAKELGAIRLDLLIMVMAEEESYIEALPELWHAYNLDDAASKMPRNEYPEANLKASTTRAGSWFWLLTRFAGTSEQDNFYFKALPKRKLLPLYDLQNGEFLKLQGKRREDHYVKLEDLKSFFEHIARRHNISLSLPWRLFGSTYAQNKTQAEVKRPVDHLKATEGTVEIVNEGIGGNVNLEKGHFKPYHQSVVNLIENAVTEMENLYEHIRDEIGWSDSEGDGERKDAALRWFEKTNPGHIQRSHLEESSIYFVFGRHSKRDVIGTLCKELISRCFPKILPQANTQKKGYGIKPLYEKLYSKVREKTTRP